MANTATNLVIETVGGPGPFNFDLPVEEATHIYKGCFVAQNAAGYLLPYSASGATTCVGVSQHEVDNTGADGAKRCVVESKRMFAFPNGAGGDAFADTSLIGSVVYATDDHTVAKTSSSGTRSPVGFFFGLESDGKVRVWVDPAIARLVAALQVLTNSPASADALRDEIVAAFG